MTKLYQTLLTLLIGACLTPMTITAAESDANLMNPGTLDYPSGNYVSMAPFSVSVTWDNQEITLTDPQEDEYGDEYMTVNVTLGDAEPVPVNAYIMSSFGSGEEDDPDIWYLDIALYDLDDLWDFSGDKIVIDIPEGIVKNENGLFNPQQDITFYIVESYNDYTTSPETGSEIEQKDAIVKISFGEYPIEYLNGFVSAYIYDPKYAEFNLDYEKEVTINKDNELVIDLTSLSPGEYEVDIPEGYVKMEIDGKLYISPDIWLEYTIEESDDTSGVNGILTDNKPQMIYTLKGVKVVANGKPAPGIYIINGKKVAIK